MVTTTTQAFFPSRRKHTTRVRLALRTAPACRIPKGTTWAPGSLAVHDFVSGKSCTAGIFGGSRFPGYVSFGQNWGQSAAYGLPGLSGLNSTNNNRDFGVSWMFRNLPVKNLSVFFSNSE